MGKSRKQRRAAQRKREAAWHGPAILAGGALVAMVFVAYAPLVNAGFIWDDEDYVVNNTTLRSLDGLRRIWFDVGATRQYYPLVHTTFWCEYHLWQLSPLGFHAVNVALHATSAVLLWRLLRRLRVPGAWLAAALFAVHPVEVESVAWITERKNVLSLALSLASMLCYLRFEPADGDAPQAAERSTRWRWYAVALVLFGLALLSKTVVASLPAVLLVIFWWKRGRIDLRLVAPLVPFFALGIGLGLLTVWMEKHSVGATGQMFALATFDRVLIAGRALWFYAGKLVWPYPLVFFYPRWTVDSAVWWQYLFPVAALVVVVGLWLARGRIGRGPLAAVLIFAGILVPALGFFDVYPFRFSFVADHFQYHASTALIALAAAGAALVAGRFTPRHAVIAKAAAGLALVALATLTFRQTFVYRDLETLYRDTIARNPTCWLPLANLSSHLNSLGQHEEAMSLARESLAVAPDEAEVRHNLGSLLLEQAQRKNSRPETLDQAIAHLAFAAQRSPRFSPTQINLAEALIAAGQLDRAGEHLRLAMTLDPAYRADAHFQMGNLLLARREPERAVEQYRDAVRLRTSFAQAWEKLGQTQLAFGRVDDAIASFGELVKLRPNDPRAKAKLKQALDAKWHREKK